MKKATLPVVLCTAFAAAADPLAYIAESGLDQIAVVDVATKKIVGRVAFDDRPNAHPPYDIAVAPDGTIVTTGLFYPVVSFIDKQLENLPVSSAPARILLNEAGTRAYVTHRRVPNGLVSVIDVRRRSVIAVIPVGEGPDALALSPDGRTLWVVNIFSSTISIIDTVTLELTGTIEVGRYPEGIAVHPNGLYLYVPSNGSGTVDIVSADGVIADTIYLEVPGPINAVISTDGRTLYVIHTEGSTNGFLSVIDLATKQTAVVIRSPGGWGFEAGLTPDGRYIYISSPYTNAIMVFDTVNTRFSEPIQGFAGPNGIAFQ
jgi:YVTN family beta-propeller protein